MTWRPVRGKKGLMACDQHAQEFERGRACPLCTPENAEAPTAADTEASELARQAAVLGLPSMLDHEVEWLRLAKKLETKADAADGLVAQRLYDSAMKARRQATAITEWREDWQRIERDRVFAAGLDADFGGGAEHRGEVH